MKQNVSYTFERCVPRRELCGCECAPCADCNNSLRQYNSTLVSFSFSSLLCFINLSDDCAQRRECVVQKAQHIPIVYTYINHSRPTSAVRRMYSAPRFPLDIFALVYTYNTIK